MGVFSKTCEYAIRAVFFVAYKTTGGQRVGIKEIAAGINSPEFFLAKILQDLVRKGVIQSAKGPHGGFYLNEKSLARPISDIVEAVDGNSIFVGCGLGLKQCSELTPCPLHFEFKEIRNKLTKMLQSTTILEVHEDLISGLTTIRNEDLKSPTNS